MSTRATVTVDEATLDDRDALASLFDGYRRFYGQAPDLDGARDFIGARLARRDSTIFVARSGDGVAVGFVQLYPSFSSVAMRAIWILNDLYVAPQARGLGAGRALMARVRAFALTTGAKRLELSTARDNAAAQALYVASGYARDDAFLHFSLSLD